MTRQEAYDALFRDVYPYLLKHADDDEAWVAFDTLAEKLWRDKR